MQPHFEVTGIDGEASMKLFLPHRWVKKGQYAMMSDIPIPSDMLFLLSRMFLLSLSIWKIPIRPSKSRSKVQVRKQFILFSLTTPCQAHPLALAIYPGAVLPQYLVHNFNMPLICLSATSVVLKLFGVTIP